MRVMFVGAGAVGSAAALETARAGYATVYLYDIETERARGKAMDICQALDHPYLLEHCADMGKASEADLVVVTAGMARQKGMTRADLAAGNIGIVSGIAADVASIAPAVPVIVVTNPSEALVYLIRRRWPALLRVFGFGCSLDQWRYRRFVAQALGCNAERVSAIVMGMHSDSMIPLSRLASVDGIPLDSLLEHGAISAIESRTRTAGTDIVNALGDHSGFVAAGRAIASFIGSLVNGNGGIYPVSIMTEGAYGIADACLALPSRVSPSGIVPMELELTDAELSRLTSCAERVLETARAHESATARR